MEAFKKVFNQFTHQAQSQVLSQVGCQVYNLVEMQAFRNVLPQTRYQVESQIRGQVRDKINENH